MKNILLGILYAVLWSSGSVAIKLGLSVAQPFVVTIFRYGLAAVIVLFIVIFIRKNDFPLRHEWKAIVVCGLLIMVAYSTLFVYALKEVTAGIGTLVVATGPILINVLNTIWLRQKTSWNIWLALITGIVGIGTAVYPLLVNAYSTPRGLVLISLSMICYAIGTVYYQRINWKLSKMSINGWQMLFATLCYIPLTLATYDASSNNYVPTFWVSVGWMVLPVSIVAAQIWLYLLKTEPTRAPLWLYACPVFGFYYSYLITHEPITLFTVVGTLLVIVALVLGQMKPASQS